MSKVLAALSGGSGLGAAAAVGVVVVAAGAWMQFGGDRILPDAPVAATVTKPAQTPVVSTAVAPVQEAEVIETPSPKGAKATPPGETPAPAFDEVRREEDGMTVIAGRGLPGALISILQNGVEIGTSTADGSGKFATLAMIPPDGKGHILTLSQKLGDVEQISDDQIILAPLQATVVAEVAPKAVVAEENSETATAVPGQETPVIEETVVAEVEEASAPATTLQEVTPENEADAKPIVTAEATEATVDTPSVPTPTTVPNATAPAAEQSDKTAPVAETAPAVQTASVAPSAETEQPQAAPASAHQEEPQEEPARVAVLKTTSEGVELLNPDAPEVMDNVAIDTISYSDAGAVQLAGRAQIKAEAVRIYLDNDAVVSLPVDAQGRWRGDLPGVDEGIYTLRVDEVAADGSVSSRVETPFKREATATLVAASAAQEGPIKAITVQKGATLWAIARDRYGSGELYVRVFDANRASIKDADLIYPGQVFDLPD